MKKTACLLVLLFIFSQFSFPTQVQSGVVITEVYPAPDTGEHEWVELYNQASISANLNDWTISDTLASPSILHKFTNFLLQPYEVFVLNLNSNKLNNTGDTVVLSDPSASYSAALSYPSSTKKLSWNLDLQSGNIYESSPSAGIVATPSAIIADDNDATISAATSVATQAGVLTKPPVMLSEIMACPKTGQHEWIELYNTGPTLKIKDWLVSDTADNTRLLSGTIPATGFAVFSWSSSMLNNNGDSLSIITDLGETIDQASYDYCQSGYSLSKDGNNWVPSQPTPNKTTVLVEKKSVPAPEAVQIFANTNTVVQPAITGIVLGASTSSHKKYPYSLKKTVIIDFTPATVAAALESDSIPENQAKRANPNPSGILGGLLLIISSLYAKEKSIF